MTVQGPAEQAGSEMSQPTRLNRDVCGGLFLIAAAALGYFGTSSLDSGSMSGIGPGLVPKAVSFGLLAFAVFLIGLGLTRTADRVDPFSIRGTIFVLGGILAFAATVRPFGLLVAGPLAMIISSIADPETRPIEIVLYTLFMTAGCYLLFKVLLRLPIPVLPPLLGY